MQPVGSPLEMAIHEPVLHQFMHYLSSKKQEMEEGTGKVEIKISRSLLLSVREAFRQSILEGERNLHTLAHLLASMLLGEFELHSNVIGTLPGFSERPFLIREKIDRDTLLSVTDIDLGEHMLDRFRYRSQNGWVPLELSANFVEYIPLEHRLSKVNRLTSRVKAEEELWNKVTDELFGVGELVSRDKHFKQFSKYVKDIFGIKIVCEDDQACMEVHEELEALTASRLNRERLELYKLSDEAVDIDTESEYEAQALHFIETKDYLNCAPEVMKQTGWRALKSVVLWNERLFEIQVQPLSNYYLEIDHMAGPSHRSFKRRRDAMRAELAERIPLYGFYRDLLRMLFLAEETSFECDLANVQIIQSD